MVRSFLWVSFGRIVRIFWKMKGKVNMTSDEIRKMSLHELLEYTGDIEDMFSSDNSEILVCFNHVLERYLYEYWNGVTSESYKISQEPYNLAYMRIGAEYRSSGQDDEAVKAYMHASLISPADLDACFSLAMVYRDMGRWKDMKECVKRAYGYIFTRTDIAQYYRYLGCYELEMYHPDNALALYRYSDLFSRSEAADAQIGFLKEAGTDMTDMDTDKLRKVISKENIPLQPDPDTIGITFKVGKNEIKYGDPSYGRLLLRSVWELTGDEEAGALSKADDKV